MTLSKKVVFNADTEEETNIKDKEIKWEEIIDNEKLIKGIYAFNFEKPSFIQKMAIPAIVQGRNIRAQAQSGTGKTGAFCVGALARIDPALEKTQCMVLVSTREIALQISETFRGLSRYMDISTHLLVGGSSRNEDVRALGEKAPQIIVGTPGRVYDMMDSQVIDPSAIKMLILDEADEMCKGGFLDQVRTIYSFLNGVQLQVLFFSATYSDEEVNIISCIAEDPVVIDLSKEEYSLQGIKQYLVNIGTPIQGKYTSETRQQELIYKVQTLISILKTQAMCQMMIFVRRKSDATVVQQMLSKEQFPCCLISSDLSQERRNDVIRDFKEGKNRILVTSDICKRGIDVRGLSLVICLDVPPFEGKEDFIHRVGRSGRYGRKGIALHILNENETHTIKRIAEAFKTTIDDLPKSLSFKE